MERKLLLLGLLRVQDMYGYQMNEFIDMHLGMSIQLKKPTAYNLLGKMCDGGWITYTEEREGNRPPRRVYTITEQGEAAFQQMLRESLADYKPTEFLSDISLTFLDAMSAEESRSLLEKRRSVIEKLLQEVEAKPLHPGSLQLMIEHQARHLLAELEWMDEVIARTSAS